MATGTIHIGELIETELRKSGMNKTEFARRIGTSRQNLENILSAKSIDTDRLAKISDVLDFNFFMYYQIDNPKFSVDTFKPKSTRVLIEVELNDVELSQLNLRQKLGIAIQK